jgi:RNA polymerase sigma factor (sigma-70 family)
VKAQPYDEKELLQQLAVGDKLAFTNLYERFYSQLYLHTYNKLRDRETAKDLIHDLFANLWAKRATLQINEGLSSYLYKSVRNRIIDYVSHQNVSSNYIQSFGQYLETPMGTTDHLVREGWGGSYLWVIV